MKELDGKNLINREISWLHFNGRVLQEAIDERNPLLERVKFLGIFSNNRDEFFRVRVATLKRLKQVKEKEGEDVQQLQEVLDKISIILQEQEKEYNWAYRKLVADLYQEKIVIINEKQLNEKQGEIVKAYFKEKVRPYIFPLMINSLVDVDSLKDRSSFLAVICKKSDQPEVEDYALVKIYTKIHSRFLTLPGEMGEQYIIFLDDVMRYCMADVFGVFGFDTFESYAIKFTRDAEIDLDHDVSKSFIAMMSEGVKKRKKGNPVRFIYDKNMPKKLLKVLTKKLKLKNQDDAIGSDRYHNFKDFLAFPEFDLPNLYNKKLPPLPHPDFPLHQSIFDKIREKDYALHYPYQSFQHIVDWLREASIDPNVRSIKMTFYRTAKYSNVVNALINAARNGKSVTVFMELQARFDEEANILLTGKFKEEGVKVIQAIPGYKVHGKLIHIKRKEEDGYRSYVNISTGNFHESTAKLYADDSLLTANQEIAKEVDRIFRLFEERYTIPKFEHLVISPFYQRDFFIKLLNKEIANAKKGKEAWVMVKLNNITDDKIANKLYEASKAGVKITLNVRGICVVQPKVKGLSDNIEGFSIVDRFLEHSRVLVFANGGAPRYFITSADWMIRNFDRRIEVTCPIYDKDIQAEFRDMLEIQQKDNVKSRIISKKTPNTYKKRKSTADKVRSQEAIYEYLKEKYYP